MALAIGEVESPHVPQPVNIGVMGVEHGIATSRREGAHIFSEGVVPVAGPVMDAIVDRVLDAATQRSRDDSGIGEVGPENVRAT